MTRQRPHLSTLLALSSLVLCHVDAQDDPTAEPSPTPAESIEQVAAISSTAGGYTITYAPGQPITITAADGSDSPVPLASTVYFINKRGFAIDARSITTETRMQVLVEGDENNPMISRVMVDQE